MPVREDGHLFTCITKILLICYQVRSLLYFFREIAISGFAGSGLLTGLVGFRYDICRKQVESRCPFLARSENLFKSRNCFEAVWVDFTLDRVCRLYLKGFAWEP